ncbi:DUF397 domain-containing protein [Streptomyces sp. B-S-A8]|uniref:DUF397 domain-containing protein n=1 Tax=Streptomyces solicavernae TaxID=3043614 RepID=A0ABT6RL40_9ACTN|nr:DUF397 domain-containing protein [Streptomyces sp. B-S-A8]MDI3385144.1 DUF397 domain-containing protein [Streptomyces sp. B-S-A8]
MTSTEQLAWFKSSYSDGGGGDCLELAQAQGNSRDLIHIRDSKNPTLPHLTTTPDAWSAFLTYATR